MGEQLDLFPEEEMEDKDPSDTLNTEESINELREQIAELNKEKAGLLKSVKAQRSKRQEVSAKLDQLTNTVSDMLNQRERNVADTLSDVDDDVLPVNWTEEGDGFIDTAEFKKMLSPYEQKIAHLEQALQQSNARQQAVNEAELTKRAIVGEDERYEKAYNKYQTARKWVENKVLDFVQENNVQRALSSGEALDNVFDPDDNLIQEFESSFPGMSLEDIVTAEDSRRHFRRAMDNVANILTSNDTKTPNVKDQSRFKKVLQKPSSLASAANAKAGELTVMDKLNSLSTDDILSLDDRTIDKLMAAMEREEKTGGIDFQS